MIRKILYALLGITLVLALNQLLTTEGVTSEATTGPTGTLEVRLSASAAAETVQSSVVTLSSVEVHRPDGWTKMTMGETKEYDLMQLAGTEAYMATSELSQGTYTQLRLSIAGVGVAAGGNPIKKARLSASRLTFTQTFQVNARNTTVIVFNIDALRSIDLSVKDRITFSPFVSLLYTRSPGAMEVINANLPNGALAEPFKVQLLAIGGQRPYTWIITMGDLPPGITLDAHTGEISGIPTTAGNYYFTVRVDDDSPARKNTTRNLSTGIAPSGALQILTGSMPEGAEKVPYTVTLQALGDSAPYRWEVSSGELPAGLLLNQATGVISGTPNKKGDYSFAVRVTGGGAGSTDSQNLNIRIAQAWTTN
jgi:hypothetical protein